VRKRRGNGEEIEWGSREGGVGKREGEKLAQDPGKESM
jgi:hypothetical protein